MQTKKLHGSGFWWSLSSVNSKKTKKKQRRSKKNFAAIMY